MTAAGPCARCQLIDELLECTKKLLESTQRELNEMTRIANLRGEEVARWADESGNAKGQRDRAWKAASFYKCCALAGEAPSPEAIASMEREP